MADLRSILGIPQAYRLFVQAIRQRRDIYVKEYVRPRPGQRILDIGCGPGDVLEYMPDVQYMGVDFDPNYIEAAKKRFGDRGRFLCLDAGDLVLQEPNSYDIVMANGLLHHLDDGEAEKLFETAKAALKPNGYLVTFDGCIMPGQNPLARMLLALDRGKFVRQQKQYETLASTQFGTVSSYIRHDLYSIPYTIIIMHCHGSLAAEEGSGNTFLSAQR